MLRTFGRALARLVVMVLVVPAFGFLACVATTLIAVFAILAV